MSPSAPPTVSTSLPSASPTRACLDIVKGDHQYTLCIGPGQANGQLHIPTGETYNLGTFDPNLTTGLGTGSGTYGWRGGTDCPAFGYARETNALASCGPVLQILSVDDATCNYQFVLEDPFFCPPTTSPSTLSPTTTTSPSTPTVSTSLPSASPTRACLDFVKGDFQYTLCIGPGQANEVVYIPSGQTWSLGTFDPNLTTGLGTGSGTYGWRGGTDCPEFGYARETNALASCGSVPQILSVDDTTCNYQFVLEDPFFCPPS